MFCALCNSVGRMRAGREERTRRGSVGPSPESGQERCEACGRPVSGGAGEGVVETLSQLARFGLTGQSILARRKA